MSKIFVPALPGQQQRILRLLILSWVVGTMAFWCWFSQPGAQVSLQGTLINVGLLLYVTGLPVWPFYLLMRMQKVREDLVVPPQLRVAMVVTKAPSEPWPLVESTLVAMLEQSPDHATWLADEHPAEQTLQWCQRHGVMVCSRHGVEAYHRPSWPRRTRCKEGNLAYFYDHHGYGNYDVVVQLDADHRPEPGYLAAMLKPFADPAVGYVAAPSICDANAAASWVARGRLYAESVLHGPMQLGFNGGWAPLCIGSHYAVRTRALRQIGGLGPELAEDHSTTLLMNAHGWRGAFAHGAICHGLGPERFEDGMVQEYQWSQSLTTILLTLCPAVLRRLPAQQQLQFLYSQIYYPLRGLLSLCALGLPALALLLNRPWMRLHYPSFLLLSGLQMVITILPIVYVRQAALLRPSTAPLLSWEMALFELSRGPWILAGVTSGLLQCLQQRSVEFRVTNKHGQAAPLPLTYLLPYALLTLVGAGVALVAGAGAVAAKGYVLLTLVATLMLAATALMITILSQRGGTHSLRSYLPHYLISGGGVLLTLGSALLRRQELLVPLGSAGAGAIATPF